MDIKKVSDPDEIRNILPIISSAWGFENMESLVKDMVTAMRFHGGLVLGAYNNEEMVGMSFSFPGYRKGKTYLYSHMTGIIKEKKYSGIGYELKLAQVKWAKENGYDLVAWTFDPLMSLNANFNIRKLGAFSRTYLRNFYGEMDDKLNRGIRTDRLVAELWVNFRIEDPPKEILFMNTPEMDFNFDPTKELNGQPLGMYIPEDFVAMRLHDLKFAVYVREKSCSLLENVFKQGYWITGYSRSPKPHYIMRKLTNIQDNMKENLFY
ncbi:hypothetical protein OXIME_001086 [Oxyplasma meridianum]|uniref:GNAT family N-acetyltransferase n=1 Tax=Oxyplasma meridianum TaxID=3073602 RepID=A0AAX4NGB7_9ARCH